MSDLIDRQAAIGGTTLKESVKALQDVFVEHDLKKKGEPMSDLIERQAAIDEIKKDIMGGLNFEYILNNMPAIDAEPVRHGRWEMKPDPYGFFGEIPVCSECGCTTKMRDKTKFCPHCGVRMVEDEAD